MQMIKWIMSYKENNLYSEGDEEQKNNPKQLIESIQ